MLAWLGPQEPGMERQPYVSETFKAHLGPPTVVVMLEWPFQLSRQQQAVAPTILALPGFVNQRLDDMLSMSFDPHIINYESSKGFIVPKFTMYDRTSDPFDNIIYFKQLMTLDIRNDALLCKVFPSNLHGEALSWFHRFPPNFVNMF